MKNVIAFFCLLSTVFMTAQSNNGLSYKTGEFIRYRIHYGLLNAGFASFTVADVQYDGEAHYKITGEGASAGVFRPFYKVDDLYETYIRKSTNKPSKLIRDIDEGGHIRKQNYYFDHKKKIVKVDDLRKKETKYYNFTTDNIQDLVSSFYLLRNYDTSKLKEGDFIKIDMFIDEEVFKFQLKILGRERMKTKFGRVNTIKVRPYVLSGRVFKESESVTMWITDDKAHIPVRITASLMIGSIKADLHEYKNLKYPIAFQ